MAMRVDIKKAAASVLTRRDLWWLIEGLRRAYRDGHMDRASTIADEILRLEGWIV